MLSFDSNILIYSADKSAGTRRAEAEDLLAPAATVDSILTLQSLAEFFHVVTRKGMATPERAALFVEDWVELFDVVEATTDSLSTAIATVRREGWSFWDALLRATVSAAGCDL